MKATKIDGDTVTLAADPGDRIAVDKNGMGINECTVLSDLVPDLRRAIIAKNGGEKFEWELDYDMDYNDRLDATIDALKSSILSSGKILSESRVFVGYNG